jgi:hypothetical protein
MHGYYSKKILRLDGGTGFYSAPVNLAKTKTKTKMRGYIKKILRLVWGNWFLFCPCESGKNSPSLSSSLRFSAVPATL